MRGGDKSAPPNAEGQARALAKYNIDLTSVHDTQARSRYRPDDEIRRTIQILQRRTKNNPVLIGEPGVEDPIVAGLAQPSSTTSTETLKQAGAVA